MQQESTKIDFQGQEFFIGIDVHKSQWKVNIRTSTLDLKTFSINPDPKELSDYMQKHYPGGRYQSVYEAGFSGNWIHRDLQQRGINNIIVSPAKVPSDYKDIVRKSDTIDCRRLSMALRNQTIKGIYIPTEKQEGFRNFCRLRRCLVAEQTRLKNRIKSLLSRVGVKIPVDLENSHWSRSYINFLSNIEMPSDNSKYTLEVLLEELIYLREKMAAHLKKLRQIVREDKTTDAVIQRLLTVPGIGFISAILICAEIIDIKRFSSFDQLASYVGLVPDTRSSGQKEIMLGITRLQHKHLRVILIESSWIAIRKDPALTLAFNQLCRRMSKQKAIIKIAKKVLRRILTVWLKEQKYVLSVVR